MCPLSLTIALGRQASYFFESLGLQTRPPCFLPPFLARPSFLARNELLSREAFTFTLSPTYSPEDTATDGSLIVKILLKGVVICCSPLISSLCLSPYFSFSQVHNEKKKDQVLQPHPQQPCGAPAANFLASASRAHLGLLTPAPPLLHRDVCYQPAPEEIGPHKQKL